MQTIASAGGRKGVADNCIASGAAGKKEGKVKPAEGGLEAPVACVEDVRVVIKQIARRSKAGLKCRTEHQLKES